jgi:excisionase family DNA binding protein
MRTLLADEYLNVQEAAAALKVNKSTIRRWIARGDLPAYRIGKRRIALKRSDVVALIGPARGYAEKGGDMAQIERQPIRTLTDQDKERARAAVAAAKQLQAELLARRGGTRFSPSWELLDELRDLRSQQQR